MPYPLAIAALSVLLLLACGAAWPRAASSG